MFKEICCDVDERVFNKATHFADFLLGAFLREGQPMRTWDWLVSMPTARRRKALVKAYRRYVQRGCPDRTFDDIKAFVKSELLPWFAQLRDGPDSRKTTYVARLIQAPHDETHIIAGPYLKPLVDRLKAVWHPDNWLFYASVSPDKLDKWLNRLKDAKSWFWSDYKAFDATYSEEAWDMIEGFYQRIYPQADPMFWRVLSIWRRPHGYMRNRKTGTIIEYQSDACNASGRDDTALANAILNGIVLALSFAAAFAGKSIDLLTLEDMYAASKVFNVAVVGDDSLVACGVDVQPYKDAIEGNIRRFGLQVEASSSTELNAVTFLGMMPYPVAGQYYWGPTIGRRMYKAFWQRQPIGNLPAWTKGVAEQLARYQCVPVMCELAERVLALLEKHKINRNSDDEDPYRVWRLRESTTPRWDQSTLLWLQRRYARQGLTIYQIRSDIDVITTIKRLPAVVHLWTLKAAVVGDDM